MKKRHLIAAGIAAFILVAAPAFAKDHGQGHGQGKGHDKQEQKAEQREEVRQGAFFSSRHREEVRQYYVQHYGGPKGCPPGLAKKNNGCLPPGQARKWAVGEPMPTGVTIYPVPQPVLSVLPPAPVGHRYERVGGDLVLVRIGVGSPVVVDVMVDLF